MEKIYNWGLFPGIYTDEIRLEDYDKIAELIKARDVLIPRGNGRCYGDSSLQETIFSTLGLNKFIFLDEENAILKCESGVLLSEILEVIVPKKLFLPVTPGTKFITVGGAVASNIHGKNHHSEGAVSQYIESMEVMTETGVIKFCSRKSNQELFRNTIGGMGLTGIILTVEMRLKKIETSYIKQRSIKAENIHQLLGYFDEHQQYTYSVAWIDCLSKGKDLGRSVLTLGEHAKYDELDKKHRSNPLLIHPKKHLNIPFNLPSFVLNKFSVRIFNWFYYKKQSEKEKNSIIHYDQFFYPLDAVKNWNRIYGKHGFTQYQFSMPFTNGKEGLVKILTKIAEKGNASFLAILKTFGPRDEYVSPISFPDMGYTLALDFRINEKTLKLLDELDEMVIEFGGRLYLSKDSRMTKETFQKTYHVNFKHSQKFNSLQSTRLEI